MNNQLDVCLWCEGDVTQDAIGGKEPVLDGGRWWHQGCLADLARRQQEGR